MEWIDEQIVRASVDEEESMIRANGYERGSDRGMPGGRRVGRHRLDDRHAAIGVYLSEDGIAP
ncbi:hypothetical protein M0D69_35205 [Caballeronia sp. SEWSISQ10-4 2]|uniref:hypothetical protein n=1 Tax=Caballeronia sp. SEWSISQ10-4 2 TaxID=2937438 RepID=UPI0026519520|nr:hypothetical protein [Caballeronia sp. SEWSISQ10-4 2]MDN7183170.1 hypothetical protein [Caballeronia sp. SEWSISQ10-4 2]